MASLMQDSYPMQSADSYVPDATSHKMENIEVSVAEIESEAPTREFDELTILSPKPKPRSITVIKHPHPHHEHNNGFQRSSSPTGSVSGSVRSFSSRRHISRGFSRRGSSRFTRSHHSEASKELTIQAESEFVALIELMAGISRRSSSLKEVWTKIISERESCNMEMDRMYEQFEEYTETIERKEREQEQHSHEHLDRKKEVSKLRLELTAAITTASEFKRKLLERDTELADCRREIAEFRDNYKYLKEEHEETKTTLEETRLKLVACDESRHHWEEDSKKHHGELRSLKQQFVELQTSYSELTSKYESTHTEIISLKQSHSILKKEKHEWMLEKGELEEGLRKCNHRNEELKRKVKEITESYEKKVREVHELQETVSKTKYESEELQVKVKELRRELEEEHSRWEDAEDRCSKWKLKWEHSEREIVSVREEVRLIEIEQTKLHETITKKTEELRRIIIEKERIEEKYHGECKKSEESHRHVLVLQESLRRTETTLKEKTELVHTLHERIERIECERDEARSKCGDLSIELSELQTTIISLKLEIETVTEERESFCEKLRECESRYEEIRESFTEYEEGSSGTEYEITTLRTMLREVREQKEKAIAMRNSADRERDEAIVKYDEKCREIERLEESFSQQFHSHGSTRSGGRTITRHFSKGSRSASTVHEHEYEDE